MPHIIVPAGDRLPVIRVDTFVAGAPVDWPDDATVTFTLCPWDRDSQTAGTAVLDGVAAELLDDGTALYEWAVGDTDLETGWYVGWFRVVLTDGRGLRVPTGDRRLHVIIT